MDQSKAKAYAAKVAALLAKAEATDNDNEAQAYYAKAAGLMLQHSIDQALIDAHTKGYDPEKPATHDIWVGGTHALVRLNGAAWIGNAAFGDALKYSRSNRLAYAPSQFNSQSKGYRLTTYGFAADFEAFQTLWNSIDLQAASSLRKYNKGLRQSGIPGSSATSRSYLMGYFTGVIEKIQASKEEVMEQVSTEGALVLRDREAEVMDLYSSAMRGNRRTNNLQGASDEDAYSQGHADGSQASIQTAAMIA